MRIPRRPVRKQDGRALSGERGRRMLLLPLLLPPPPPLLLLLLHVLLFLFLVFCEPHPFSSLHAIRGTHPFSSLHAVRGTCGGEQGKSRHHLFRQRRLSSRQRQRLVRCPHRRRAHHMEPERNIVRVRRPVPFVPHLWSALELEHVRPKSIRRRLHDSGGMDVRCWCCWCCCCWWCCWCC